MIYNSPFLDPDGSPSQLQRKVMFDIRYYMCRRGGENIHGMTKDTFQLHYDNETKIPYVKKVIDEIQKNHTECDNEIITGFMPQMLDHLGNVHKLCPVRAFENYLNKLHPNNNSLWQKPAKQIPTDPLKSWYENVNVGHNTHDKFMTKLSTDCKLSKKYTNHCLRVTGITSLKRGNFSDKQVMSVSGHKSIDSLAIYQRVKSDEKLMMGMCLTFSLMRPEDAIVMKNTTNQDNTTQNVPALPAPPIQQPTTTLAVVLPQPNIDLGNQLIPLESAISPFTLQEQNENDDFDLMSLLQEVENDDLTDEQLVLAATQCEAQVPENDNLRPAVPFTTTTTTALMRKVTNPAPTFTNCTFGTIGTVNIHIHKH